MTISIQRTPNYWPAYAIPFIGVAIGSIIVSPLREVQYLSDVTLLYVLAVVLTGVKFGRGPAISCAIVSSLAFAYVFVPPYFSLAITKWQNLLSAGIMLLVALLVGHLTASLRSYAETLEERANRSLALYELARRLAGKQTSAEVKASTLSFLCETLQAASPELHFPSGFDTPTPPLTTNLIQASIEHRHLIYTPDVADNQSLVILPLIASTGAQGVLSFKISTRVLESSHYRELAETVASLVGVALERTHFAEIARQSELKSADQNLRFTILSSLSHDIRTPITSLIGTVDTLMLARKLSPEKQDSLLNGLRFQAQSIHRLVSNLLEMAKLQLGSIKMNKEWQPIEEVIGTALRQAADITQERTVAVDIADNLPPLQFDAVLVERVLWNLIENACKYSPEGSPIEIAASKNGEFVDVAVCDRGPGLPHGKEEDIFRLFQRGVPESSVPGAGLGLAIAHNITEAHQGKLLAENREGGGSCFHMLLPAGAPPTLDLKD